MKIVHLTAGSGDNFYCENCLRDVGLIRAIHNLGHEILMVPLYLPPQIDQSDQLVNAPIFFGGINVYLQQKYAFFRKSPRWLDRLFDRPALLRWVARKASMTEAKDLGQTTLSMLQGENGRQQKELRRLITWLSSESIHPDLLCLPNLLLAGLARAIKKQLSIPVVCLLQDEHSFIDNLGQPYSRQSWQLLAERCRDIDAFISVSHYYADYMQQRLDLPRNRIHVAHIGIPTSDYHPAETPPAVPTIGYLSRICPQKGLQTLIEAFILLKRRPGLENCRLRIAGGYLADDRSFLREITRRIHREKLTDSVEFLTDFDKNARLSFLQSLSVLCVPEKEPPAFGLYVLEALATAVPVVQPETGPFPELIQATQGGLLAEPNNPDAFAEAIAKLLLQPDHARKLAHQGRQAVLQKFDLRQTAQRLLRIYDQLVNPSSLGRKCSS